MITQREVVEAVNNFKVFSETTLRRYVNELLRILDDEQLIQLAFNEDIPHSIRRKAYQILKQRNNNIIDNSVKHDKSIEG